MQATEQTGTEEQRLDVRQTDCSTKFGLIMETWNKLEQGRSFVLINGHDPLPLYYQLSTQNPTGLQWDYLQRGPEVFEIRIGKLVATGDAD